MTYDKAELVALDKKYVWHHLTPVSYTHLTLPTT